ncbi:MAG: radical SAM protein [Deltaproteobacteria bacterium]|uniref:elongator complex protein 3 n=1 Tax=Hydrosulfovibrio ferrireducens TaxID=2934181 RepID=UPI0011FE4F04|nr:MAG: radical SAM protein [Deltaproteobacteria bacterium]
MPAPFVIPVFIAHQGCPHQCLFCNQRSITGAPEGMVTAREVEEIIRAQLAWPRRHPEARVQVAFYGGSFTGLALERQRELLGAAQPFLASGQVRELRLSTRPDYVTPQIAGFLREQGVGIVELGAQSLDDGVLAASGRGHTADQVRTAVACLKETGIRVGLQLMLGLPSDTTATALASARRAAALGPDMVRLYPCLVIEGSPLAELYRQGKYQPQSLFRAVALAGRLWSIFKAQGIPVVRMGLQPSPSLKKTVLAGPYHPAFGELVLSRLFFNRVRALLSARSAQQPHRLCLAKADESIYRGKDNGNVKRLAALGLLEGVETVFSASQPRHTLRLLAADT